jgi:hypothetical protein
VPHLVGGRMPLEPRAAWSLHQEQRWAYGEMKGMLHQALGRALAHILVLRASGRVLAHILVLRALGRVLAHIPAQQAHRALEMVLAT